MNKFSTWLEANRGMASTIADSLKISKTNITNAKTGRLLMPTGWMPTIVKLSKRKLTFEELVLEREEHRKNKKNTRLGLGRMSSKANN